MATRDVQSSEILMATRDVQSSEILMATRDVESYEMPGLLEFKRIDGPWSWVLCSLFFICNVLSYGFISTYGIFFPNILEDFGSGKAIIAIPGSVGIASVPLFGIVIGKLCDRYGCRRAMLIGGLCCALGLVASSFAPGISLLVASYGLVLGFGVSLIYFSTMVGIPVYFDKYSFEATSIVSTGPTTCLIIMAPIVQHFNKFLGWRTSLQCLSGISLVFLLVGLLMRSFRVLEIQENERGHYCLRCRKAIDFSSCKIEVFLLAVVVNVIFALGHQMPFLHMAKFCDDIGISSELSSWLYFTIGISSTFSRLLVSIFGKKGCLSLPNILLFGIITLALGNFLLPSLSQYHWLVLYCINYGMGDGFFACSIINIIMECLPTENRGGGFGLMQFFVGIGYIIGPIISGFIADISGSYIYAFYTAGSLESLAAILSLLFHSKKYRNSPSQDGRTVETQDISKMLVEGETVLKLQEIPNKL